MRADRESTAAEAKDLFETLWSPFEGDFWREPQRRGRLTRPRLEWFFQTTLQSILGDEVEIGRLYANYRRFALGSTKPVTASGQLKLLNLHASNYRQLISGAGSSPIAHFGRRVSDWDASTTHPLALRVADSGLSAQAQKEMYDDIVSYLVRRAVCGLTSKNYNKIFAQQLKKLLEAGFSPGALRISLGSLEGDASRWPSDSEFKNAWLTHTMYRGRLDAARTKSILVEVENGMRSARSEEPLASGLENLDVDHILPTEWFEYWPLSDGSMANSSEAADGSLATLIGRELTDRQKEINRREWAKASFGNLTLLHYGVNRGLQNREFLQKREKMFTESNLHLNRELMRLESWNEESITQRGLKLFDVASRIWKGAER